MEDGGRKKVRTNLCVNFWSRFHTITCEDCGRSDPAFPPERGGVFEITQLWQNARRHQREKLLVFCEDRTWIARSDGMLQSFSSSWRRIGRPGSFLHSKSAGPSLSFFFVHLLLFVCFFGWRRVPPTRIWFCTGVKSSTRESFAFFGIRFAAGEIDSFTVRENS